MIRFGLQRLEQPARASAIYRICINWQAVLPTRSVEAKCVNGMLFASGFWLESKNRTKIAAILCLRNVTFLIVQQNFKAV